MHAGSKLYLKHTLLGIPRGMMRTVTEENDWVAKDVTGERGDTCYGVTAPWCAPARFEEKVLTLGLPTKSCSLARVNDATFK